MTKEQMKAIYTKNSKSDKYIIGFIYKHNIYAFISDDIADNMLMLEHASRNQGESLRLRIRKPMKEMLVNKATYIGTENMLIDDTYNKGDMFEKLIFDLNNQKWKKDDVRFYVDCDIRIDNIPYQIKLDSSTLLNTKLAIKLNGGI